MTFNNNIQKKKEHVELRIAIPKNSLNGHTCCLRGLSLSFSIIGRDLFNMQRFSTQTTRIFFFLFTYMAKGERDVAAKSFRSRNGTTPLSMLVSKNSTIIKF